MARDAGNDLICILGEFNSSSLISGPKNAPAPPSLGLSRRPGLCAPEPDQLRRFSHAAGRAAVRRFADLFLPSDSLQRLRLQAEDELRTLLPEVRDFSRQTCLEVSPALRKTGEASCAWRSS